MIRCDDVSLCKKVLNDGYGMPNCCLGADSPPPTLRLGLQASSPLAPLPKTSLRLYPDSARDIVIERHALRRDLLLGVYAAQAIMLAFTIKLKVRLLPSGRRLYGFGAAHAAGCRLLKRPSHLAFRPNTFL